MNQARRSIPVAERTNDLIAVCRAISAETSEAQIFERAVVLTRDLTLSDAVRIYVGNAPDALQLRASAPQVRRVGTPDEGVPSRVREVASSAKIAYEGASCFVPIVHDRTCHGVLVLEGGAAAMTAASELDAIGAQVAIAIANAEQYATLEGLVDQEMSAAVDREQAMQLVLDSMGDGLLVCNRDGTITPIRSKSVCAWFGEPSDGTPVWDYLAGATPVALQLAVAFEAMADDVLPFEVNCTLGPARIERSGRTYSLGYKQVFSDGVFTQIVVSIVDVTEAIAHERAERAARELPGIAGHLIRDRAGFMSMLEEIDRLLGELGKEQDHIVRARVLHTLKGNTAIFGFRRFAEACHILEDDLSEDSAALDERRLQALREAWEESLAPLSALLTTGPSDGIRIRSAELLDLLERLERQPGGAELAEIVRAWQREPAAPALEGLGLQAKRLASDLGKEIDVRIDAQCRLPERSLSAVFAQLVHAVRNAIDHGIEAPTTRRECGKAETATLRLCASTGPHAFVLTVADDGAGIDWERVRAKAASLGLSTADDALPELLFHDGLSTRDAVSEVSGRGVGMGSLRETVRSLGGEVRVESVRGEGTRVICTIPLS